LASLGQLLLMPVHVSATSQVPPAARHTVDDDFLASLGQLLLLPVHVSASSQVPPAARHTWLLPYF